MKRQHLVEDSSAEAINMKARSYLMIVIRTEIERRKGTQAEAAAQLGVSQPRLNDLLRGRIKRFSVDALLMLASRAGLVVRLEAVPLTVEAPKLDAPVLTVNPEQSRTRAHGAGADTKRSKR